MIDFNINIGSNALLTTQAMNYAKRIGLRAFALTYATDELPDFVSDTDILYDEERRFTTHEKEQILNKNSQLLQKLRITQKQIHTLSIYYDVQAYFAIKLMHIPPALLESTILQYRFAGVEIIGVYGETISDMVEEGTNFAACNAKADILYCPGLIDEKVAEIAAQNQVYLEISTSPKHSYCNAHIAHIASKHGAKLVIGSDAKCMEEIHSPDMQGLICKGARLKIQDLHNYELHKKLQNNLSK